jgi:hypothetical protein
MEVRCIRRASTATKTAGVQELTTWQQSTIGPRGSVPVMYFARSASRCSDRCRCGGSCNCPLPRPSSTRAALYNLPSDCARHMLCGELTREARFSNASLLKLFPVNVEVPSMTGSNLGRVRARRDQAAAALRHVVCHLAGKICSRFEQEEDMVESGGCVCYSFAPSSGNERRRLNGRTPGSGARRKLTASRPCSTDYIPQFKTRCSY